MRDEGEDGEPDADRDGEEGIERGDEEVIGDDGGEDVEDGGIDAEDFADFDEDNFEADDKEGYGRVIGAVEGSSAAMLSDMEEVMLSADLDNGKRNSLSLMELPDKVEVTFNKTSNHIGF